MNLEQITLTNDINLLKQSLFELHADHSKLKEKQQKEDAEYQNIILSKDKVIQQQSAQLNEQSEKLEAISAQFKRLYEDYKLFRHGKFGRSSEKYVSANQLELELFDEPGNLLPSEIKKIEAADEEISVAAHKRKKKKQTGRSPLPADLPREEMIHDLRDDEKFCHCGHPLHKIGEDCSEQLEYIPAQLKVIRHIRYKYASKCDCEGSVKMAPIPKHPIPKSIATPSLLTHIMISKYSDHLPLYRQEKIFKRLGIDIPRHTFCSWILKCADLFEPVVNLLKQQITSNEYAHADETPVRVLNHKGKPKTGKSYMFVYVGGDRAIAGRRQSSTIIYDYQPTRSGQNAKDFLKDFKGKLQCDAYAGYNVLTRPTETGPPHIQLIGCWAHARRKFHDIVKITKTEGLAHKALETIQQLYKVEDQFNPNKTETAKPFKALAVADVLRVRQEQSKPILETFKAWLDENYKTVPPKSNIGKAMNYALSHWDALIRYADDGQLSIDNNIAENAIRPFAIGRKNWLFAQNEKGARASAIIYSLIETCKANGVDMIAYLKYILEKLPYREPNEDYQKFTPQNYKLSLARSDDN